MTRAAHGRVEGVAVVDVEVVAAPVAVDLVGVFRVCVGVDAIEVAVADASLAYSPKCPEEGVFAEITMQHPA